MMNLKFAEASEQLRYVDIFFSGLDRKTSNKTFSREIFNFLLLLSCNCSHMPPSAHRLLFFC